jgi:hypothetical protein
MRAGLSAFRNAAATAWYRKIRVPIKHRESLGQERRRFFYSSTIFLAVWHAQSRAPSGRIADGDRIPGVKTPCSLDISSRLFGWVSLRSQGQCPSGVPSAERHLGLQIVFEMSKLRDPFGVKNRSQSALNLAPFPSGPSLAWRA